MRNPGLVRVFGLIKTALLISLCLAALVLSVVPGMLLSLLDVVFFFAVILIPVLLILGSIAFGFFRAGWRPQPWNIGTVGLIVATLVLLVFNIPRRLAFRAVVPQFEEIAGQIEPQEEPKKFHQKIGGFLISAIGTDSEGGIYFVSNERGHGIGPDTISSGFCKNPNSEGTPFGAAKYRKVCLFGEWYSFQASNDYF